MTGPNDFTSSPIRRNLLRDQVRWELINRIISGQALPGDRLNEAELATELQISRTPLKEAILALERDGFVEVSRSRGHVVKPLSLREIEEVYPIRMGYEVLVVTRYPPADATLQRLEDINRHFAAAQDPEDLLRFDNDFHATLASDCANNRLRDEAGNLEMVVRRYHRQYNLFDVTNSGESARGHQAIIDAVRAGDAKLAAEAVETHWDHALSCLVNALRADLPN